MFIKKSSVLLGLFVALSFSPLCSFANDDIVINNDNFTNHSGVEGGAIHTNVNNVIVSDNVSFIKNKAQNGAAISVQDSGNIILQDNIDFISNESTSHGGAVYSAYGGNFSIGKNARFINNVAGGTGGHGGAIYAYNNKKDRLFSRSFLLQLISIKSL